MMPVRAFGLATLFGALPLTFIYNYFGAALVMSRALALLFGFLVVAAVFILDRLIERYDLSPLRSSSSIKRLAGRTPGKRNLRGPEV